MTSNSQDSGALSRWQALRVLALRGIVRSGGALRFARGAQMTAVALGDLDAQEPLQDLFMMCSSRQANSC